MSGVAGTTDPRSGRADTRPPNQEKMPSKRGDARQPDSNTQRPAAESDLSCGNADMNAGGVRELPAVPALAVLQLGANTQAQGGTCSAEPSQPSTQARPAAPAQNTAATIPEWKLSLNNVTSNCREPADYVRVLKNLKKPEEREYVVDLAILRSMDLDFIDGLAEAVNGDLDLRNVVVERLFYFIRNYETVRSPYVFGSAVAPALNGGLDPEPTETAERRKKFLYSCAGAIATAWRPLSDSEVSRKISSLPQDQAAYFAFTLSGDTLSSRPAVADALGRRLVGLIPASGIAVGDNPVQRLSGILQKGLFSGPAVYKAKVEMAAAIVRDNSINAASFTTDNPFANRQLQKDIAPLYATAGDVQGDLSPTARRNVIALTLGLTPAFPDGVDISLEDLKAGQEALAQGKSIKDFPPKLAALFERPLFAKNNNVEAIERTMESRAKANGVPVRFAVDYNVVFTELGPVSCPVYRLQIADFKPETAGPEYETIDNTGRDYPKNGQYATSDENYFNTNQLPEGDLYRMPSGPFRYRENGVVVLEHRPTPESHKTVEHALDAAISVGCLVAGVAGVVFTGGGSLALAASVTGMGWNTYRGIESTRDSLDHGQDVDGQVVIGMVATAFTALELGAPQTLAGARALGWIGTDSRLAKAVLVGARAGAIGTHFVALATGGAAIATDENLTRDQRLKAGAALFFHAVLGAKPLLPRRAVAPEKIQIPLKPRKLPEAVASKGAKNQNLALVKGGEAQNTRRAYDPTRGRASNENAGDAAAHDEQQWRQPLPMAANGGEHVVSTGLDTEQPSAVGSYGNNGRPPGKGSGHPPKNGSGHPSSPGHPRPPSNPGAGPRRPHTPTKPGAGPAQPKPGTGRPGSNPGDRAPDDEHTRYDIPVYRPHSENPPPAAPAGPRPQPQQPWRRSADPYTDDDGASPNIRPYTDVIGRDDDPTVVTRPQVTQIIRAEQSIPTSLRRRSAMNFRQRLMRPIS